MTDLVDINPAAGEVTFRRPDGTVAFAATDRSLQYLGRVQLTDALIDFSQYAPETYTYVGSGEWDQIIAQHYDVRLTNWQPYTFGVNPTWYWGAIRLRREKIPVIPRGQSSPIYLDRWLPFVGGSRILEGVRVPGNVTPELQWWRPRLVSPDFVRSINFSVSGGQIGLELHQSCTGMTRRYASAFGALSPDAANNSMTSRWRCDVDVAFGVFDL